MTPVPTLVFHRRAHVVSLAEVPNTIAQIPLGHSALNGLSVLAWREGSVTYVAISDAMPDELDALRGGVRQGDCGGALRRAAAFAPKPL